jgi:hypothetical protein
MNPRNFSGDNMAGKLEMIEMKANDGGDAKRGRKPEPKVEKKKHNEKVERYERERVEREQEDKMEREREHLRKLKHNQAIAREQVEQRKKVPEQQKKVPEQKKKIPEQQKKDIVIVDEIPQDDDHEIIHEDSFEPEEQGPHEYELEIRSACVSETQRLAVEKELLSFTNSLRIPAHDFVSTGNDNELEVTWHGEIPEDVTAKTEGKFFSILRKKLYDIAMRSKICFEVDYNSEFEPLGTSFVGVGEDDRESDYLLIELFQILPRLSVRSSRLAKRFSVSEDALKKAFNTLNSLSSR